MIFTFVISSCSNKAQTDREFIISLIFNSQIGNEEHFGQSPPIPALAPNFEELKKYDKRVAEWKERMKKLNRKIIFLNKSEVNNYYKELTANYVEKYGFEKDFLNISTNWDKSNIKNQSEYEILNSSDFPNLKVDSIHVGILQISEIGFNKKKDKAVVYFDWLCGRNCGNGNLAVLNKQDSIWKIKEILNLWIL